MSLKYKTTINVGGLNLQCVEDYESVFARWRDATMKSDGDGLSLVAPMELTINGEGSRAMRAAIAPTMITAVFELFEDQRTDVAE